MEPMPHGGGYEFVNDIFGGSIPKNWIPSVDKGIQAAAARGFLAGFPVVDFKVSLYDGKYHDVDSSDTAFQIAGSLAFKAAMQQAKPALIEPIMKVEVYSPSDFSGDLMGDVSGRRGKIQGMDTQGAMTVIKAEIPMAEMLEFANALTALTQGRGSYHMEFSHYDYLPKEAEQKVIAQSKRPETEAQENG
jgi:elongation factor G